MTKGGLTEPRRDMAWVLEAVLKALVADCRARGASRGRKSRRERAPCDSLQGVGVVGTSTQNLSRRHERLFDAASSRVRARNGGRSALRPVPH